MTRLTRDERQARTRETLLTVATTAFLRDGYLATSLDRVADEAGFSKGAVYSNFGNKDELCLAVLDRIHAEQTTAIAQALAGPASLEERLRSFAQWAERTIGDPSWTGLECEFATRARHVPALRAELTTRETAVRDLVRHLLEITAQELGVTPAMPPERAANLLLSLGIGLGVRRMVDPAVDVTVLTDMVRLLLGAPRETE
jgi:AcrR family transcriptional regulator